VPDLLSRHQRADPLRPGGLAEHGDDAVGREPPDFVPKIEVPRRVYRLAAAEILRGLWAAPGVLRNDDEGPSGEGRLLHLPRASAELADEVPVVDALELVDPEPIEVILLDPELRHAIVQVARMIVAERRRTIPEQRPSPRIARLAVGTSLVTRIGEVKHAGRERFERTSARMVHDDVEDHADAPRVARLDEQLQIDGIAHVDVGSKEEAGAVPPVQRVGRIL